MATIERLDRLVPPEQIHYCFLDDMVADPTRFAAGVFRFLEVLAEDVGALLPAERRRRQRAPARCLFPRGGAHRDQSARAALCAARRPAPGLARPGAGGSG
jgi:hypothetical protein